MKNPVTIYYRPNLPYECSLECAGARRCGGCYFNPSEAYLVTLEMNDYDNKEELYDAAAEQAAYHYFSDHPIPSDNHDIEFTLLFKHTVNGRAIIVNNENNKWEKFIPIGTKTVKIKFVPTYRADGDLVPWKNGG